jgi:hypothetical protein
MASLITDEMLDAVAVSGTYETIGVKLRERYTGLLDRISLYEPCEAKADGPVVDALLRGLDLTTQ